MTIGAHELIVDSFAGGGGASLGIEMALGRSPDIAINHDGAALAIHRANHPDTEHLKTNIWRIDPRDAVKGRPVGLLWASPDCTHHSKAKGGKPKKKHIRDLAWVVVLWAQRVKPRIIMLENVEEFADWGPLLEDGQPCKVRKGFTFKRWVRELRKLGYKVDWRELRACDYDTPTVRKRLFLIARRDGLPIVWPKATNAEDGARGLAPWRTAAEIIDWSLGCPSIFLTRKDAKRLRKEVGLQIIRPLAAATMARIARGIQRYVIDAAEPFIVRVDQASAAARNGVNGTDDPLRTVTTAGSHAVVTPFMTPITHAGDVRTYGIDEPVRTVTAAHRGEKALISPYLVPRYGERPGQEPRTHSVEAPAPTVVPTANGGSLVAAVLVKNNFGSKPCQGADDPLHTVTTQGNRFGLVASFLAQHNTDMVGHDAREPVSTIVGKGCTQAVVAAHMAQHNTDKNGGAKAGRRADAPLSTVTMTGRQQSLVATHMLSLKGSDRRASKTQDPVRTVTANGQHIAEVRAFLTKYYSSAVGQKLSEPAHTTTARARLGLVTVAGGEYQIADIGMRMLTPRELFRAQGFPDSYIIDPVHEGKPLGKTAQIKACGNSVCPPVVRAIVLANVGAAATAKEVA